jgi:hypothetical protein
MDRCDRLLRILSAVVLDAYEASTRIGVDEPEVVGSDGAEG